MPDPTELFTGNENHEISLSEAASLTSRYRQMSEPAAIKGEYFSKSAILALLNNPAAVGIRIYYGIKPNGDLCLVLSGVQTNMDDILNPIMEMGKPCPTMCGISNPLNS